MSSMRIIPGKRSAFKAMNFDVSLTSKWDSLSQGSKFFGILLEQEKSIPADASGICIVRQGNMTGSHARCERPIFINSNCPSCVFLRFSASAYSHGLPSEKVPDDTFRTMGGKLSGDLEIHSSTIRVASTIAWQRGAQPWEIGSTQQGPPAASRSFHRFRGPASTPLRCPIERGCWQPRQSIRDLVQRVAR